MTNSRNCFTATKINRRREVVDHRLRHTSAVILNAVKDLSSTPLVSIDRRKLSHCECETLAPKPSGLGIQINYPALSAGAVAPGDATGSGDGAGDARRLLLVLLNQTAHGVGRLSAARDPMFDAIQFQPAVVIGFLRIVVPNDLDEFAVARTAFVRHHDFVVGAILRAFSA